MEGLPKIVEKQEALCYTFLDSRVGFWRFLSPKTCKEVYRTVLQEKRLSERGWEASVKMDIRIVVAAHKAYWMPDDPMYLPLHVGRCGCGDIGFSGDDTGEHISDRNRTYCELTGLYWAWKNLDAEYVGLVHYRRHFAGKRWGEKRARVITQAQLVKRLERCDVLLPQKRHYFIENTYDQYVHAHHAQDLNVTRDILVQSHPRYVQAFDACMKRESGHRFNMLVMKREKLKSYCTFLFSVLFELERRLDITAYSDYDARVFGFVGERLLDVWLEANDIDYEDIPYVFMEKQNWLKKGAGFIRRKLAGGRKRS